MQRRILLHIAFWFTYVLLKGYLNFEAGSFAKADQSDTRLFLLSVTAQLPLLLVKIPLVYSLFYFSGKYLSGQWKFYKTILFSLLLFISAIFCFIVINHLVVINHVYNIRDGLNNAFRIGSIIYTFFLLCFVSGLALTIKLVRENMRQKETEQEIIKKKLETELQFLKAQTNPHFLFNTLNNIYALARKKSDNTADVVLKLSKLLRFMLYESQKENITISEEIQVIDDYIELEKIRYSSGLKLNFLKSVDNELELIAPLILLPFVENAFKHGASESRFGSIINIDLYLLEGNLYFKIENSISSETQKMQPEKLGLKNIKRQLELLYPEHSLEIENDETHFAVTLNLKLNKSDTV
jgi:two-component system LytT family sensor kinase